MPLKNNTQVHVIDLTPPKWERTPLEASSFSTRREQKAETKLLHLMVVGKGTEVADAHR